jgi:hypothetical protein
MEAVPERRRPHARDVALSGAGPRNVSDPAWTEITNRPSDAIENRYRLFSQ